MHGKRFDEDELELVVHGKLVHGAWRESAIITISIIRSKINKLI